ncbi:MAG: nucleotide exchange factor GrpE [Thermoanaerobaculia bacterium]
MKDDEKKTPSEDDAYVLEDTGETIEDIEDEMERTAREAVSDAPEAGAAVEGGESTEWRERYVRTMADYENFRKRTEREKADFFKYAMAGMVKDLLPVLDNFDRALDHAAEGDDFHQGVLMIYKHLYETLQKHGLRPIEESNVPFDPRIHEGVVREENPSVPSHTVVAILQKGYFLHDRLLRPALVKVAVGGPEPDAVH